MRCLHAGGGIDPEGLPSPTAVIQEGFAADVEMFAQQTEADLFPEIFVIMEPILRGIDLVREMFRGSAGARIFGFHRVHGNWRG